MLRWVPPTWRAWLRQTRLPILHQFIKAVRLGIHLKRLGQMLSIGEVLHTREEIERLPALEKRCRFLEEQAELLRERTHTLQEQTNWLIARHHYLYDQTDLLKSAREVPVEWFEEFHNWKLENPLPETPRVSACVATWNRSHLLTKRCLPSLMRQTYKHLEIVVVGDGCTDDTAERIADLGDPRIRFINLPQRGHYPEEPTRRWMVAGTIPVNHALSLCTGDFITHLDDDDEHDPTRVEKLLAFARANELDFVWHPFWYERIPNQWDFYPCEELRLSQVTTSSIFYRSWLARIGWDINAHMLFEPGDWNRLRKFLYLGVKAQRFPEPLLRHYKERSQPAAAA